MMTNIGLWHSFNKHLVLSLMVLVMPFVGTEILGSNIFGITGMKPLNVLAILLFSMWLLKGGAIIKYNNIQLLIKSKFNLKISIFC